MSRDCKRARYEPIRRESVVALLGAQHALAGEGTIPLGALAEEAFVLFPRELAPRLYDAFIGLCRRSGFETKVRRESFHTGWELRPRRVARSRNGARIGLS